MKYKIAGCAAAAALSACLLAGTAAGAVDLKEPSGQTDKILAAADKAGLLPDSMDGQQATASVTKEQACSLAVRLYASISGTDYTKLMAQDSARRALCPFSDTQNADVQEAWLLALTQEESGTFSPRTAVTRQQLMTMLYQAMQTGGGAELSENEIAEALYSYADGAYVPDWAREAMAYFVRQGLTSGTGDDLLGVGDTVGAEQAAVLTYRAAAAVHTGRSVSSTADEISTISTHSGSSAVSWTGSGADYYLVYFYQADAFSDKPVCVEQVSSVGSGAQELALPDEVADAPGLWYWSVDGFDCDGHLLATSGSTAELAVTAATEEDTSLLTPSFGSTGGVIAVPNTGDTVISSTIPSGMTYAGESYSEKVARIFGEGASYHRYASASEAQTYQTEISVQVWDYDGDGNKVTRTKYLWINKALASTVQQIFAEIYAGGEQFPIHTLGGYNWRGNGSSSEHCLGTAIDINWEENYMCTNSGTALTGSYWKPGTDPYSIPANGEVVQIFQKYGFGWGGTWNSKKDYMHFSYFGT